ncbi:MbtH protein [Paraburkholderia sp. GAS41]|uniref:MbtH family NRPS accessory protein n=1 Tax=Paraburkholderia sp. GAS41 TaxID=3035134 RepID=UPI003D1E95A7
MDDVVRFAVVFNQEGQYSIWANDRPAPAGWSREGYVGTRHECLEYISRVWSETIPRIRRQNKHKDANE